MIYGLKFDKFGYPYIMGTTTGSLPVTQTLHIRTPEQNNLYPSWILISLNLFIQLHTVRPARANQIFLRLHFWLINVRTFMFPAGGNFTASGKDPYDLQGTLGMPTTPDAMKKTTDNHDFYFIVLKRDASALLYGTFFGQDDTKQSAAEWCCSEHVDGGTSRYDKQGTIYEAICANCEDHNPNLKFPTTPGARYRLNGVWYEAAQDVMKLQ